MGRSEASHLGDYRPKGIRDVWEPCDLASLALHPPRLVFVVRLVKPLFSELNPIGLRRNVRDDAVVKVK